MKCDKIREMLSPYVDQMLDDNLKKQVEEHILTCNLCKKEYDDIKEMTSLLNEVEMVPVPESFELRMKNALQQERAKVSEAKIISIQARNKKKLRLLTSVAAIFAVGLISAGLYQDIIGNIPYHFDKTAQFAQDRALNNQAGSDLYEMKMYESNPDEVITNEKEKIESNLRMTDEKLHYDVLEQQMSIFGSNESSPSDIRSAPIPEDSISEPSTGEGFYGYSEDYSTMMTTDEFSRALTTSGIERNVAAIQYYKRLIEDRLRDFKYEILESNFVQAGECKFRIYVYSGKEGYNFNEEIIALGKDGEIEFIYTNEFMGL